jgi:hypothetical protein
MAAVSLAALALDAWGQPPLPPAARPHDVGVVLDVKPGESIRLETGARALISEDTRVIGPHEQVVPGDLVELAYGPEGIVSQIAILPCRAELQPLSELLVDDGVAYDTYWEQEEEAYPNSLRTAGARFRLSTPALQLVGHATYDGAEAGQVPAIFRILDESGNALWEQQLAPGQVAAFRCSMRQASRLQLKCAVPDKRAVSHRACVWLSPMLMLRQMEYVPLRPELSGQLVRKLAERLGQFEPGTVAIGMPQVIGLAAEVGRDLRDDLFVAAPATFKVVGALPTATAWPPNEKDREAAKAMGATSILASRVHCQGAETRILARMLTVAHNEELAAVELTFE